MKNKQILIGLIIVILIVVGFLLINKKNSATVGLLSSGKTAQSAYGVALKEVRKKSSDSYLVDIYASVDSKGESSNWYVEFYSPSTKEIYKAIIKNGQATEVQTKKATKTNPVGENWLDSSKIISTALKECGQVIENDYFTSLDNISGVNWTVDCVVGENKTLRVIVNAVTGEFVKTRKAGIGW